VFEEQKIREFYSFHFLSSARDFAYRTSVAGDRTRRRGGGAGRGAGGGGSPSASMNTMFGGLAAAAPRAAPAQLSAMSIQIVIHLYCIPLPVTRYFLGKISGSKEGSGLVLDPFDTTYSQYTQRRFE
jgi:hypothetical protein